MMVCSGEMEGHQQRLPEYVRVMANGQPDHVWWALSGEGVRHTFSHTDL